MSVKKHYEAEFKARVAIEAIKEQKGVAEICSEYKIPNTNLYQWRDKAIGSLHEVFVPESEYTKQRNILKQEIETLQRIIGEITVENSFLKKKLMK